MPGGCAAAVVIVVHCLSAHVPRVGIVGAGLRSGVAASAVLIIVPHLTAHVLHLTIVGAGSPVRSGVAAAVTVAYKNTNTSNQPF